MEIRATICPSLRYALSRTRLINTVTHPDGIDFVNCDYNGATKNNLMDGKRHFINGKNIYVPVSTSPDYGKKGSVWLESCSGERIGSFDMTIEGGFLLAGTLKLDCEPASKDCVLVVETYGTKEAAAMGKGKMLRHSIKVRLV